ncbi:bifunctional ADP-dependent NAD(P)H-hydrate dehydratase/NAD(P)H-hydrate epimerase [Acidihalobacter ferrooxydans]|uniref:Bifunctional NAD(P)H-hydrate repair enzyme n=1 Tax=Acidihalobacter ferrooxydans TaxID=1765967 RepID=A0A1P8UI85_9GAMM|nr:bifunctional ADP-dependent NAD(P)H-hydrate dehydratase/NAD(P)H-hydrate epimerase [Acidihalobacter ferrooxydans]APZ43550.1 bifunctional ADP-dependent (S)-NAD(P)H-hydrate dehydratase/NAD(P)H-hydrate epimerase [Acidihalobacter ferrooxydans]
MTDSPLPLYVAAQARAVDRRAIDELGIPGYTLMRRAGAAAFETLRARWPQARSLCAVCGSGNNGGDGLVVASLARQAGWNVRVMMLGDGPRAGGEAAQALADWRASGGEVEPFGGALPPADVYLDALFGTGLTRAPEGRWSAAIDALAGREVLALDVPSGLDADHGHAPGTVVRAQATISFIVRKRGLYTGVGPECAGERIFAGLDVPPAAFAGIEPQAMLRQAPHPLARRSRSSHKGDHGRVLIVGGAPGMSGAARLAGEAALRVGAGLVTVATHPAHAATLNVGRWELMVRGVRDPAELAPLLASADIVAVGPGLGSDAWGRSLWSQVLGTRLPLVVDADALNLLAQNPVRREHWVLTPHPGEAGRLLGCTVARVQSDRFAAVAELVHRYGGTCVLKGAGSLVQTSGVPFVCAAGNPGMASGGMGDVLTGVIAGLAAQGLALDVAVCDGVCLHAAAGDMAARDGERGLLAADVIDQLRRLVNAA